MIFFQVAYTVVPKLLNFPVCKKDPIIMWFVLDAFLTDSDRIQAFEIIFSHLTLSP